MFKTYSNSSSLVITSRWFATSRLGAPVSMRLVYLLNNIPMAHAQSPHPCPSGPWVPDHVPSAPSPFDHSLASQPLLAQCSAPGTPAVFHTNNANAIPTCWDSASWACLFFHAHVPVKRKQMQLASKHLHFGPSTTSLHKVQHGHPPQNLQDCNNYHKVIINDPFTSVVLNFMGYIISA